jgi:predicted Zn-ribbon and HTH transcriptional regulator
MEQYKVMKLLLKKSFHSLEELAYETSTDIKYIREDLQRVINSLEGNEVLVKQPPQCKNCGFEFTSDRTKPSKCPECKHEKTRPAQFRIEEK